MKTYVLYHSNCRDGFAAAWAAWKDLGEENVSYIPVGYGRPAPEMDPGSRVFIVDFSYPKHILSDMAQVMESVVVLDHHKSAKEDLEGLPGLDKNSRLRVHFNMDKSGAGLAWEFFHGGRKVPKMIQFIEDRDLWRFAFQESKRFCAFMNSLDQDFTVWNNVADEAEDQQGLALILAKGNSILQMMDKDINRMCWARKVVEVGEGVKVVVCNATVNFSETCERLLELESSADFAAVYGINYKIGQVIFSLRSRQGTDVDVGKYAQLHGGGGHKHASGFKVPLNSSDLFNIFGGILT